MNMPRVIALILISLAAVLVLGCRRDTWYLGTWTSTPKMFEGREDFKKYKYAEADLTLIDSGAATFEWGDGEKWTGTYQPKGNVVEMELTIGTASFHAQVKRAGDEDIVFAMKEAGEMLLHRKK